MDNQCCAVTVHATLCPLLALWSLWAYKYCYSCFSNELVSLTIHIHVYLGVYSQFCSSLVYVFHVYFIAYSTLRIISTCFIFVIFMQHHHTFTCLFCICWKFQEVHNYKPTSNQCIHSALFIWDCVCWTNPALHVCIYYLVIVLRCVCIVMKLKHLSLSLTV